MADKSQRTEQPTAKHRKEVREKGSTETIVLSARLNMEPLIKGTDDWVKQW